MFFFRANCLVWNFRNVSKIRTARLSSAAELPVPKVVSVFLVRPGWIQDYARVDWGEIDGNYI